MGEEGKDHLVRNVGIAAGAITVLVVAVLVAPELMRDRWEFRNVDRVLAKLEEADRLQKSDSFAAYKMYDELLKEAQQHTITSEGFSKKLVSAEISRNVLYQEVEDQIRAEEAKKKRLAEKAARLAAKEKQRVAVEQERKLAAEEAQRIAKEKQQAQENRRKEAVAVYNNAPSSARSALNVVKKLHARIEVGVNYANYSTVVGEAWAEVKVFAESPEGKSVPEFSELLVSAMAKYKLALEIWQGKLGSTDVRFDDGLSDIVLKECWRAAARRSMVAESLLNKDGVADGLSRAVVLGKSDETYEAIVRSLFIELLHAHLNRKMGKLRPNDAKNRSDFEDRVERIRDKLKNLVEHDSQEP